MIKRFIVFFSLILLTINLYGQSKKLHIGFELMPTIATQFTPKISDNPPLRFSFSGGFMLSKEIVRKTTYIKSGLYLYNRGYGYTVKVTDPQGQVFGKYRYTEHLNYLSLPLNIGFKFGSMYFEIGPQIDYFIYRRQKHDAKVEDTTPPNDINKLNIGGNLSFGTLIYPNSRRKTYSITLGGFVSATASPVFFNAGIKLGLQKRLK